MCAKANNYLSIIILTSMQDHPIVYCLQIKNNQGTDK